MIDRTEALAIRVTPFSKTSHVVTWLTPTRSRLSTVVKGACRPKSLFLGQYDLFYTCELLFYTRERGNGLHIARECRPIHTREALRADWRASGCASYVCDLVHRSGATGESSGELYRLASSLLDFLCASRPSLNLLFWFELRFAAALGFAPRLSSCGSCDRADIRPGTDRRPWRFHADCGSVLCPDCAGPDGYPATPDILAILRRWQAADSPRTAQNTRCAFEQLLAFRELLAMFFAFHLDPPPFSRAVAIDLLANNASALTAGARE
ncbi:MAG: DNA repair protein RecO [Verrucomicrobiota bacterium]|nr:DNA repair protein RecO [Verrucomicrobiota bacterium]